MRNRFFALDFLSCGSGKVSHISATSFFEKYSAIWSIWVRRKATLFNPFCNAFLAPTHILFPFRSTPIKFLSGYNCPSPTAYSPLPHASSRTIGLLFLKCSLQFPCIPCGTGERYKDFSSSNSIHFFVPVHQDKFSPTFIKTTIIWHFIWTLK